jgi:hypothetical protein
LFIFWYHSPNILDTPRMHIRDARVQFQNITHEIYCAKSFNRTGSSVNTLSITTQILQLQLDVSSPTDRKEFERKWRWPNWDATRNWSACCHKISHDSRWLGRDSKQASWIQFQSSIHKTDCLGTSYRSCSIYRRFIIPAKHVASDRNTRRVRKVKIQRS